MSSWKAGNSGRPRQTPRLGCSGPLVVFLEGSHLELPLLQGANRLHTCVCRRKIRAKANLVGHCGAPDDDLILP